MLIEPFQICDLTILDSRLVRSKGEIRFILEELNFPLSLSLLYRASEH
jgi:TLD